MPNVPNYFDNVTLGLESLFPLTPTPLPKERGDHFPLSLGERGVMAGLSRGLVI